MGRRKYRFSSGTVLDGWVGAREDCVLRWLGKIQKRAKNAYFLFLFCDWAGGRLGLGGELSPQALLHMKADRNNMDAEYLLDDFVSDTICPGFTNSMKWGISKAVKSFFLHNYRELQRASGKVDLIKQKPYRKHTKKELQTIYRRGCYNPRDRALVTFIFSTAICRGTIPHLKWSMFEDNWENRDTPHIAIPGKFLKGQGRGRSQGVEQHTFLTFEAKMDLITYRDWAKRNRGITFAKDSPVFIELHSQGSMSPISYKTLGVTAFTISNRSGVPFSWHDARRYVQTALEEAKLSPNWIRKIKGRKVRGEDNPYSRPEIEKLRKAYLEAVQYLVFLEPALAEERAHEEIRTVMKAHEIERQELQKQIDDLKKQVPVGLEQFYKALQDPDTLAGFVEIIEEAKKRLRKR